jgi:uncharacterized protein (DUF1697 family)
MTVQTYIILLRGVMPSGKNKVPMAQLRQVLTDAGFHHVRTYIASGNVLLNTDLPVSAIAGKVRQLIKEKIGSDLPVIVKTRRELQSLLDCSSFQNVHDQTRLFFVFFAGTPNADVADELELQNFGSEKLALFTDGAILYIPGTYGKGKLSSNYLEKQLGIAATMRNLNTLTKLIELSND